MLFANDSQPCRMCLKKSCKAVIAFSLTTVLRQLCALLMDQLRLTGKLLATKCDKYETSYDTPMTTYDNLQIDTTI